MSGMHVNAGLLQCIALDSEKPRCLQTFCLQNLSSPPRKTAQNEEKTVQNQQTILKIDTSQGEERNFIDKRFC